MLWKIAWKNIIHKPLNSVLCLSLILFGVSIISLLIMIQKQFEEKFERDLKDIDLVMGAKGSPLQLVLSAVYHLDAPTGNIKLSEAQSIMDGPMIEEAIPLAYGDSYEGYRILGTTIAYIDHYGAEIEEGRAYSNAMETTIGYAVAKKTGLKIGDTFMGTHGEVKEGHVHEDQSYTVVGILKENNSVLDNLVLTEIESVWQVHSSHDEHSEGHHEHSPHPEKEEDKEITAVLLKCKSKLATMSLPRVINQQTTMQAVLPGLEINQLFYMLGIGVTTLKLIAGGIMLMAAFSVFFVLYGRLRERKHELALMRSVGYRPRDLFGLLLLEGVLFAFIGYVLGTLLSRWGIYMINQQAESDFNLQFESAYIQGEWNLLLITLLVGVVSALLPAWKAMRMNVSTILAEG
ncbi:MAG: FtsX-like permease family protein [Flavobacteriales bacterium]|nr:FtsX-like permease family protein [Flavobacteriales bacterium]